jgi:hypothetical protein
MDKSRPQDSVVTRLCWRVIFFCSSICYFLRVTLLALRLLIILFILGLSRERVEWLADSEIGQDGRESDCDPIWGTVMTFPLRDWGNSRIRHVSPYRDRESTQTAPRFNSEVSPLESVFCLLFLSVRKPSSVVIWVDIYIIKSRQINLIDSFCWIHISIFLFV